MKSKLLLLLGIASTYTWANSPFGLQDIKTVSVHDSGNLIIHLKDSSHSEACVSEATKHQIVLNPESAYQKEMFAIALAAKTAGKQINGWVNGCITINGHGFPKATAISTDDK